MFPGATGTGDILRSWHQAGRWEMSAAAAGWSPAGAGLGEAAIKEAGRQQQGLGAAKRVRAESGQDGDEALPASELAEHLGGQFGGPTGGDSFLFAVPGGNICTTRGVNSCKQCLAVSPLCAWCSAKVSAGGPAGLEHGRGLRAVGWVLCLWSHRVGTHSSVASDSDRSPGSDHSHVHHGPWSGFLPRFQNLPLIWVPQWETCRAGLEMQKFSLQVPFVSQKLYI